MGSKTRSLGLSSLVVTTLDKGAALELQSNGWKVTESPPKTAQSTYHGVDSIAPSRALLKALNVCKSVSSKDTVEIDVKWPTLTSFVKKLSFGWRKRWNRRLLVLNERGLVMYKAEKDKVPYKTLRGSDIIRIEKAKTVFGENEYAINITFRPSEDAKSNGMETWTISTS